MDHALSSNRVAAIRDGRVVARGTGDGNGADRARKQYQVGMRLKAKNACTVKGYAIKQGVILTIAAVHVDDAGKPRALDLSFSEMIILDVEIATVNQHFRPA